MLKRTLFVLGLVALFTLALQGCPPIDYYTSMQVVNVEGRPYLIAQFVTSSTDSGEPPFCFSIFTPGENGVTEWEALAPDRMGHALGVFVFKPPLPLLQGPPAPGPPPAETPEPPMVLPTRLGICHGQGESTFFDITARPVTSSPHHVPFSWRPLTAVEFKGAIYAFGLQPDQNDIHAPVPLKAAKFDGEKWTELKAQGPSIKLDSDENIVDVDAVATADSIKVYWRAADDDRSLGFEGPRFTADGPLAIASFDGNEFSPDVVSVSGLPRGNISTWFEDGKIRCLVQTRVKLEESLSANGPMELWTIDPQNRKAERVERIEGSASKPGLMAFIAAKHFEWNGVEYILRSNWQMFEVWQRTESGWKMIRSNPKGLPRYDLESVLLIALGCALGLIAFGAFLAYRRRKQAWTLIHRIQAHDIYATLSVRAGAYAIDIALVVGAAMLFGKFAGVYVIPLDMIFSDFTRLPYWPYFTIYMLYFCGSEWLLGTTLGKTVMGLSVVMDGGKPLSFTAAFVRNLVGFAERIPHIVLLFVWPMILLSPRRQRLGDMLGRSFVVHKGALEVFKQQREQELAKLRAEALAAATPPAKDAELTDAGRKDKQ